MRTRGPGRRPPKHRGQPSRVDALIPPSPRSIAERSSAGKLRVRVTAVQPLPQQVSKVVRVVRLVRMMGEHRDHFLAQVHSLLHGPSLRHPVPDTRGKGPGHTWTKLPILSAVGCPNTTNGTHGRPAWPAQLSCARSGGPNVGSAWCAGPADPRLPAVRREADRHSLIQGPTVPSRGLKAKAV
jgi:hypothetical protein